MQADSESDFPGNGASDILDGIESAREDLNAEDASVASPDVNVTLEDDTGIEQVEDDDFDDDESGIDENDHHHHCHCHSHYYHFEQLT